MKIYERLFFCIFVKKSMLTMTKKEICQKMQISNTTLWRRLKKLKDIDSKKRIFNQYEVEIIIKSI